MKKLVGYGFSLPSKPNLLNIQNLLPQQFLFVGRLKPYPTEFWDVNYWKQGLYPDLLKLQPCLIPLSEKK